MAHTLPFSLVVWIWSSFFHRPPITGHPVAQSALWYNALSSLWDQKDIRPQGRAGNVLGKPQLLLEIYGELLFFEQPPGCLLVPNPLLWLRQLRRWLCTPGYSCWYYCWWFCKLLQHLVMAAGAMATPKLGHHKVPRSGNWCGVAHSGTDPLWWLNRRALIWFRPLAAAD